MNPLALGYQAGRGGVHGRCRVFPEPLAVAAQKRQDDFLVFDYSSPHLYIFSLVYTSLIMWTCTSSAKRDLTPPFALLLNELCSCFDD